MCENTALQNDCEQSLIFFSTCAESAVHKNKEVIPYYNCKGYTLGMTKDPLNVIPTIFLAIPAAHFYYYMGTGQKPFLACF